MPKQLLQPQGEFPVVGLGRRLAAMFYDFLLCTALLIVTGFIYKLIQAAIIGEERLRVMTDAGQLDGDPLYSTVLLLVLCTPVASSYCTSHGDGDEEPFIVGGEESDSDGSSDDD